VTVALQGTAVDWMSEALCLSADPDLFFPEPGRDDNPQRTQAALRVCRDCPVKADCLRWALETEQQWGVLGEKTASQRTRIRNRKAVPSAERQRPGGRSAP
jgi:WhiB family redox-sensing transcriptional regulator